MRLLSAALALMLALLFSPSVSPPWWRAAAVSSLHAPGEVIVKLKRPGFNAPAGKSLETATAFGALIDRTQTESAYRVEPLVGSLPQNPQLAEAILGQGLDRIFVVKFDDNPNLAELIAAFQSDESVEYAEPNYLIRPGSVLPNDPRFAEQWPLSNPGFFVDGRPGRPNADIKAPLAWSMTTGDSDVIVAVTDTGIDLTHPDLANNIYTNEGEIVDNGIDDDNNGYVDDVHGYNVADNNGDTSDVAGHGTQVAGIIAASLDNNVGIAGVSQSRILPVRFFRRAGNSETDFEASVADAARSLVYAISAGASIVNASWTTLLAINRVPAHHALALKDAVAATESAGVLLVCIAGNEGFDNDLSPVYPGAYQLSNQIVVAASDVSDEIWHPPFYPFIINSGFGRKTVHLAAPGVSVLTTSARGGCVLCVDSEDPASWYGRMDGTSASGAYVSGVAALIKSQYPDANYLVLRRRIIESVDVIENLERYVASSGRLNAARALSLELETSSPELTKIKYKASPGKLVLDGTGLEKGARVVVGRTFFPAKLKTPDLSRLVVKVPISVFPVGVSVEIRVVNPDGGQTQALTLTR